MLINLAFIKAVNGLFYFALDYIAELEDVTSTVLVRTPALAEALHKRFPDIPIRVVGPFGAARAVHAASKRGEMVFTASSHPIPGIDRQIVVVHDSYPFDGIKGAAKATLFFLAMRTSRAMAGHINLSDARAFLLKGGLAATRFRSTPNHMAPPGGAPLSDELVLREQVVIGLFGTDSPKKNYERIFASVAAHEARGALAFRLYGQPNAYADGIIAAFPQLDISLTSSKDIELETFIRSVDIVASAATREGFSRPMALALSLGVPCWIVDAPVFREFYGQAATFYADAQALSAALAALSPGAILDRPTFAMPKNLERDFRICIDWLRAQDAGRL